MTSDAYRAYMRANGQKGGRSRSPEKLAAARGNMAKARETRLRRLRQQRALRNPSWTC